MSRLLFRGIKTFWKTKSSIDLVIVEYSEYELYEIIAYDPKMKKHAPRIYVSGVAIKNILNGNVGASNMVDGALTNFLFNHLTIIEYLPETRSFKIDIQAIFHYERNCDYIISRPPGLPLFASPFDVVDR